MDWEFFFRSEHGRDRLLRDRLEEYQSHAAAMRSSQRRDFDRQISSLRGNLETRLDALSRAFEAYVELDDVREQLAGFPEQALARRRAAEALEQLAQGRPAEPVADVPGYWLPPAVNALGIGGVVDRAQLDTALTRDEQSTRRFLTGVLGATGHGTAAAEHALASLADARWDPAQQLIWLALADGVFGVDAVTQLGPAVQPRLAEPGVAGWQEWLTERARTDDERLRWVLHRYDPAGGHADGDHCGVDAPDGDSSVGDVAHRDGAGDLARHREDLLSVAMIEVTEGSPSERELIVRARELRTRVRDPWNEPTPQPDDTREVLEVLRQAASPDTVGPPGRLAREWIAPHLLAVLNDQQPPPAPTPVTLRARAGGLEVAVSAAGADTAELNRVRATILDHYRPDNTPLIRGAAIAGGLLVLAAVAWLMSWTPVAIIVAIGALAVGVHGFWRWQQQQQLVIEQQDVSAALDRAIGQTRDQAIERDQQVDDAVRRSTELLTRARAAVAAVAGGNRTTDGVATPPVGVSAAPPPVESADQPAVARE